VTQPDGTGYYWHVASGEVSWEAPYDTGASAAVAAPPLPPGWVELKDAAGNPYWWETSSDHVSWHRPQLAIVTSAPPASTVASALGTPAVHPNGQAAVGAEGCAAADGLAGSTLASFPVASAEERTETLCPPASVWQRRREDGVDEGVYVQDAKRVRREETDEPGRGLRHESVESAACEEGVGVGAGVGAGGRRHEDAGGCMQGISEMRQSPLYSPRQQPLLPPQQLQQQPLPPPQQPPPPPQQQQQQQQYRHTRAYAHTHVFQ